jgi:energy-converting hydrogenase Eha subunit A
MELNLETIITGLAVIGGLALVISMIILERRPRKGLTPRLIPTTPVMFAGVIVIVLALLHFLTMAGRP